MLRSEMEVGVSDTAGHDEAVLTDRQADRHGQTQAEAEAQTDSQREEGKGQTEKFRRASSRGKLRKHLNTASTGVRWHTCTFGLATSTTVHAPCQALLPRAIAGILQAPTFSPRYPVRPRHLG